MAKEIIIISNIETLSFFFFVGIVSGAIILRRPALTLLVALPCDRGMTLWSTTALVLLVLLILLKTIVNTHTNISNNESPLTKRANVKPAKGYSQSPALHSRLFA